MCLLYKYIAELYSGLKEKQKRVEITGIEPVTLCMLSTRATNCAKSPCPQLQGQ